jgi:hypothetical protein
MDRSWRGAVVAGTGVVASAAAGVVTNLVTAQWSWSLGVLLATFVIFGAALSGISVISSDRGRRRTIVRQRAQGGSVVNSVIDAAAGARVYEGATRLGEIRDVHTRACAADVYRVAKNGKIEGGSIMAS